MNTAKNPKICSKCKKPMVHIAFWDEDKKVHEYWICGCKNK
jgi:hypothetical protein